MPITPFGFFVPTKDLRVKIETKKAVKDTDFTVLTHSINSSQESALNSLRLCAQGFPKEFVRNLVCLKPERLIHNEILAQLQATVKLDRSVDDDESSFRRAYALVNSRVLSSGDASTLKQVCDELYSNLLESISLFVRSLPHINSLMDCPLSPDEKEKIELFYASIATKEPWSSDAELLNSVIIQRSIAYIYTSRVQETIAPIIDQHIGQLCASHQLERLSYVKEHEGLAIFTTGGVASGKGSCLKNIEESLKRRGSIGIAWSDLVHHNADRIKPFLLDPKRNSQRYSQYTYEEALAVKERTMSIINQRGTKIKCFPHFMHDQTKLKAEELIEANSRYGELIIAAVSTDAETAIERAYQRGEKTDRFEHTEGLLSSHQAVPGELIKALNQSDLIGSNISVAMYDNNTDKLKMFASINMKTREIKIYDEHALKDWIKKETINPKADSSESLYTSATVQSTVAYFSPLIAKGFLLDFSACPCERRVEGDTKTVATERAMGRV